MRIAIVASGANLEQPRKLACRRDYPPAHADIEITVSARSKRRLSADGPMRDSTPPRTTSSTGEDEPTAAYTSTRLGRELARWCGRAGVTLLHVSNRYVFGAD